MVVQAERTALYRLYNSADQLLYIGISADPKVRWAQHAVDKDWWPQVLRRDVEWMPSRAQAEAAERHAIVSEKPVHNSKHSLPALSREEVDALFADYKSACETERRLRPAVRAAAVDELRLGATVSQLARRTGLTSEVFRRIARDAGVDRLRPPTNVRTRDTAD